MPAIKMQVRGVRELQKKLKGMGGTAKRDANARLKIGYSAPYAAEVHERTDVLHSNGQAKFLEQPLRENKADIAAHLVQTFKNTRSMVRSLYSTGLLIGRLSQPLVPVLTGFLKRSWFVRVEGK